MRRAKHYAVRSSTNTAHYTMRSAPGTTGSGCRQSIVCLIGCRTGQPDPLHATRQRHQRTSAPKSHDLEIFISNVRAASWSLKSNPSSKEIAGARTMLYHAGQKPGARASAAKWLQQYRPGWYRRHRSDRVCLASGLFEEAVDTHKEQENTPGPTAKHGGTNLNLQRWAVLSRRAGLGCRKNGCGLPAIESR